MCIIPGSEKDAQAHREIDALTAAMATHGSTAEALYRRGVAHKQLGHLPAAIDDLTVVTRRRQVDRATFGRANHFLAVCLRRTGAPVEALDAAEQALECNPSTPSTWVHRGYLRSILGEHESALDDYERSLELDPTHGLTYIYRGNGWFWQQDYTRALADYDTVIDRFGSQLSFFSFHNRGAVRLMAGDLDGALADLDEAEARRPTDLFRPRSPKPLALRGFARLLRGDLDGADDDLHRSSHLGDDAVGITAWALLEAARGRRSELIELGRAFREADPDGDRIFATAVARPLSLLPRLQPLVA